MSTVSQPSLTVEELPTILRYCRRCEGQTPHEIHTANGMRIAVCVRCSDRALLYELDRD
jgi:hypothetical protein